MTIERGKPWGSPVQLDESAPVVTSDAELADVIRGHICGTGAPSDEQGIVVGVRGGDLHRTLGSPRHTADELRSGKGIGFPIDVGVLEPDAVTEHHDHDTDTGALLFVAHMVATTSRRGTLWNGRTVIAMNAAFRGEQNLAPRSHPNDGRLAVIDGRLGLVDRRRASTRTSTGSHLPHPDLTVRHIRQGHFTADRPLWVRLDGRMIGTVRSFALRCIADAATIVV